MLEQRPVLDLEKSALERMADGIAMLSVIASMGYLVVKWSIIPDTVATHFNFRGEPDGWGNKWLIVIPLIIGVVIWIGMHFLEKIPQSYNYLWLTEENVHRQYKNAQLLVNSMKNIILVFFSFMTFESVRVSLGEKSLLGAWELPVFLIVLFGTMFYFVFRSYRLR